MQANRLDRSVEVSSEGVTSLVVGFGPFQSLVSKLLAREGIGTTTPGGPTRLEPGAWYSLAAWLRVLDSVIKEAGATVAYNVGASAPKHAILPPSITDIDSAMRALDIAYHLNHRIHGQAMFDLKTGTMVEGIGHYGYQRAGTERAITITCANPYPCDVDRGIVTGFAARFEAKAQVGHGDSCRKNGAPSCSYLVSW